MQLHGRWKLHIHEGKGLKDRLTIPLTQPCLDALRTWEREGQGPASRYLFTAAWAAVGSDHVGTVIRAVGRTLGFDGHHATSVSARLRGGTPELRESRESALQKMMGHKTLDMTLEYARILDTTVEHAFQQTVERMQTDTRAWVPSFFATEEYTLFAEGDTVGAYRRFNSHSDTADAIRNSTVRVTSSACCVTGLPRHRATFPGYRRCASGSSRSGCRSKRMSL